VYVADEGQPETADAVLVVDVLELTDDELEEDDETELEDDDETELEEEDETELEEGDETELEEDDEAKLELLDVEDAVLLDAPPDGTPPEISIPAMSLGTLLVDPTAYFM
jgi:hypothetical protein